MKKNKEISNLYDLFINNVTELDEKMQLQLKKVKQENNNLIIEEKVKLLQLICEGEKIDFNTIKYKYMKQKDVDKVILPTNILSLQNEENIFNKTIINEKVYYYEYKEDGKVLDDKSNIVGYFINNEIVMN
jgi:hypothetical protein